MAFERLTPYFPIICDRPSFLSPFDDDWEEDDNHTMANYWTTVTPLTWPMRWRRHNRIFQRQKHLPFNATSRPLQLKKRRDSCRTTWNQQLQLPSIFSADNVRVREEGGHLKVTAERRVQGAWSRMQHMIAIPEDVDARSVKTHWVEDDHCLVIEGQRSTCRRKEALRGSQEGDLGKLVSSLLGRIPSVLSPLDDHKKSIVSRKTNSKEGETDGEKEKGEEEEVTIIIDGRKDREADDPRVDETCEKKTDEVVEENSLTVGATLPSTAPAPAEKEEPSELSIDVAGFSKDDVDVQLDGRTVRVSGRQTDAQGERSFLRVIRLSDSVDPDQIQWSFDGGELPQSVVVRAVTKDEQNTKKQIDLG